MSGGTNAGLPRVGSSISPYLSKLGAGVTIGMRSWDDTLYPTYGKVGDTHIYSSANANGLNIISADGTGSEDYIRFYAGGQADTTSNIHIQGTGSTKGFVGLGTESPTQRLTVDGNVSVSGFISATANTTTDAFRVTQLGTGNAFVVEDTISTDTTPFVIDNSGNVGIGITSPETKLHLVSDNTLLINNRIRFTDTDTTANNNQFMGRIDFETLDTAGAGVKCFIGAITDVSANGELIFGTTGTTGSLTGSSTSLTGERMRINKEGFVGINQTLPTVRLDVSSGARTTDQISARFTNTSNEGVFFTPYIGAGSYFAFSELGDTAIVGSSGENLIIGVNNGAAWRFSGSSVTSIMHTEANVGVGIKPQGGARLHVDGTIRYTTRPAAGTITAIGFDANGDLKASSSSRRFKENIQPYNKGLNDILSLSSVTFTYSGENITNAGFIAEDLNDLGLSEFVIYEDNQPTSIPYGNMVSLLVNGIKEQNQLINELRDEIELLKQRLNNP